MGMLVTFSAESNFGDVVEALSPIRIGSDYEMPYQGVHLD